MAITLNSRRNDAMRFKCYVGQSGCSFTHDVTYAQHCMTNQHSSVYEASWSKKVPLRQVGGKHKYFIIFENYFILIYVEFMNSLNFMINFIMVTLRNTKDTCSFIQILLST